MINSDHLLDLAGMEARPSGEGAPRQAYLRRAVSTAYYEVFHAPLWTIATEFVGAAHWKTRVIFYRSVEHGKVRDRCKRLAHDPLPNDERLSLGLDRFPEGLRLFAAEFVSLQELRHEADCDPDTKFSVQEAQDAVDAARQAVEALRAAKDDSSLIPFLSYLLLGLRR